MVRGTGAHEHEVAIVVKPKGHAVIEQASDDARAAFNLGTLYLQRARGESRTDGQGGVFRERALQLLERAVRLQPGDESAQRALNAARAEAGK